MESEIMEVRTFGIADYVVFGCVILISIIIGIFFAFRDKRHNTSSNFFLGNRKMKALPVALSFIVTFQSSVMMLGYPAEVYAYGLQWAMHIIGFVVAYMLAALIVVPLVHPLKVTSIYEYYSLRFGTNSVRYVCVMFGVCYYTIYMGIVMFGTALALQSTAGLPLWSSILIFASSAIFYTSLGGIKAVIWTDVFQSFIMLAGILSVIIKSVMSAGGLSKIVKISENRINLFNFDPDPTERHTFWTLVIGIIPQYFYCCITQAGVQRIISTPSTSAARKVLYIATPVYSIVMLTVMFEGISVFAYFSEKGCDPLASGKIKNPNQLIPFTILEMFESYPGMPGLFIAALAAASLSTISSGLSGLATVTCIDILMVVKPNISDNVATNISKLSVVLCGLVSVGVAFFLFNIEGPLGQIFSVLAGAVGGPETGIFLLAVFFKRCRPKAIIFAAVIGLAVNIWLMIGQTFSSDIKTTPYLPPGPTDKCNIDSGNKSISEEYGESSNRNTSVFVIHEISTTDVTFSMANQTSKPQEHVSALGMFYSISYMYFHLIGTAVTMIIGLIGSLLTQPKVPPEVDEKYVLPLSIFIPSCLRKKHSKGGSISTDTDSEESTEMLPYKSNA